MDSVTTRTTPISLKADFFPFTVVKIRSLDINVLDQFIQEKKEEAPQFFHGSPVVLDITLLSALGATDLTPVCDLLKSHNLKLVGVKGAQKQKGQVTLPDSLSWLHASKKPQDAEAAQPAASLTSAQPKKPEPTSSQRYETQIVSRPLRSGARIYAREANLVLLAPVNPGAECIADGCIYAYAPLRGRALAGARGDSQACIICQDLDAELLSISGHYLVQDELPMMSGPNLHVYLDGSNIQITSLNQTTKRKLP